MKQPTPSDAPAGSADPDTHGAAGPPGHAPAAPIDLAEQSVAGEEDPGAAFDDGLPSAGG